MSFEPPLIQWQNRACRIQNGAFYLSRVGNPNDWDTTSQDAEAAIFGTVSSDAEGEVAVVTSLEVKGDSLQITTSQGVFVMENNPLRIRRAT